jgi:hypothetical protein
MVNIDKIDTSLSYQDYPILIDSLLTLCQESISNPNFDSSIGEAVSFTLLLVRSMLPTEEQAKAFLNIKTALASTQ